METHFTVFLLLFLCVCVCVLVPFANVYYRDRTYKVECVNLAIFFFLRQKPWKRRKQRILQVIKPVFFFQKHAGMCAQVQRQTKSFCSTRSPEFLPVFEQDAEGHLTQSQIIWQQLWPIPVPFCDGWLLINEKTLLLVINQS